MKRKIFSKLLMVALVIAAVGSFVSCKDYDDDINNLQKQIDAKAAIAQIESLQSQLTAAQTAAQKAQTDATKALADAAAAAKTAGDAATAKALEDAIAKVNAAAEKAATENAAAIKAAADAAAAAGTDAAAAKTAADEAKAAAEKAAADAQKAIKDAIDALVIPTMPDLSGYATKGEVLTEAQIKALISQNAQAKGEYLTATTLSAALADLGISASSGQVDLTEINNAIAAYKTAIDQLYSMVTSVELVGSFARGNGLGVIASTGLQGTGGINLGFVHGKQATDEPFGNNEDKFFQFDAADQIKFKAGDDIRTNQTLLIRVNPTNASFTKDQIQFVDTKGRDLSDYIEIQDPYRFTGLITRSTDNSGLWCVPVKVKDGAKKGDFNRYVYDGGSLNANNEIQWGNQILYAVAIKNTTDAEGATAARYVASTYDIRTGWTDYVPANYFNLSYSLPAQNVWGNSLFGAGNRWGNFRNQNTNAWEDGIEGENGVDRSFDNPELTWIIPGIPAAVPTNTTIMEAGNDVWTWNNAGVISSPFDDRRPRNWGYSYIEVELGETLTLSDINNYARRYYWDYWNNGVNGYDRSVVTTVEYFYVTFDLGNAIESRPSEYNAWKSYKFDGLDKMTHSSEALDITFNDATAAGDYIGFRVYAVNYDGTLVDPDGRAFYVHVKGQPAEKAGVNVTITANTNLATYNTLTVANQMKNNNGSAKVTQTYESSVQMYNYQGDNTFDGYAYFELDPNGAWDVANGNPWNVRPTWAVGAGNQRIAVHYQILDKDGNIADNWNKIASVKVSVDNPGAIADGQTLPAIYLYSNDLNAVGGNKLNELYIYVKKELTNKTAAVVWRETLKPDENNLLVVYPRPWNANTPTKLTWNDTPANVPHMEKDLTQYVDNKQDFEKWVIAKKAGLNDTEISLDGVNVPQWQPTGTWWTPSSFNVWSAVSEATKINNTYDSYIVYTINDLRAYYDNVTRTWLYNQPLSLHAWDGKVQYADVISLFSYGLNKYKYTDDATKESDALYIKWLEIEDGTTVRNFWGDSKTASAYATRVPAAGNVTLSFLLKNTTSDSNKRKAVNAGIVESAAYGTSINLDWSTISGATSLTAPVFDKNLYPGGITATLSGGNITSLITISYNKTTEVFTIGRFVNTDGTYGDVPTGDVSGTITVKGKDSYGVTHTIIEIPVKLLYNK
jgi:hypothetical protein